MDPRRSLIEVRRMRSKVGKLPEPYKYKIKQKRPDWNLNRQRDIAHDENLTGFVHDIKASVLEERFARALSKHKKSFTFSYKVLPPTQIPGQANEIDFIVSKIWPVEVDGTFVHKSAAQRAKDVLRDAILNDYLEGMMPIQRVPGYKMETQEMADSLVESMFYG